MFGLMGLKHLMSTQAPNTGQTMDSPAMSGGKDDLIQIYPDIHTVESLHNAVQGGSLEEVERALEDVHNIDATLNGKTALIVAIEKRDLAFVEFLINNGASVNRLANTEVSPLNSAVENRTRDLGILKLLVQNGADIFEEDCHRDSILMNTVFRRDSELVRLFNDMSRELCDGDDGQRKCQLSLAASCCVSQYETAENLLKRGVSPNSTEMSPLILACCHGDVKMVKILLDYGADANIEDPKGGTPLSSAVYTNSQPELVRLLVENGAEVNRMTTGFRDPNSGVTPLMEGARMRSLPLIQELLRLGADANIQNEAGKSALHFCTGLEVHASIIKSPLNNISTGGPLYRTNSSSPEIVQALINHGADVLAVDGLRRTPLCVNLQTLQKLFSTSETSRLGKDMKLVDVYFAIYEVLLKAGAGSYTDCSYSFSLVIDAFLSCSNMDLIPAAESFPDLAEFAIISGVKLNILQVTREDTEMGHKAKLKLIEVVDFHDQNSLSLKQLCRISIRKAIQPSAFVSSRACNVPALPKLLKEYLAFE